MNVVSLRTIPAKVILVYSSNFTMSQGSLKDFKRTKLNGLNSGKIFFLKKSTKFSTKK